jgi:hypothetical protein
MASIQMYGTVCVPFNAIRLVAVGLLLRIIYVQTGAGGNTVACSGSIPDGVSGFFH